MENLTQTILDEINANAEGNADANDLDIAQKCLAANPYMKEHWNLTLQCEITNRMPIFAKVLEDHAKFGADFNECERTIWNDAFAKMKVQKTKHSDEGSMVRGFEYNGHGHC